MNLDDDPIAEIYKAIRSRKKLETQVRGDFQSALPVLKDVLSHQSGQSAKIEHLVEGCWNGEHRYCLACLDPKIAQAVVAMIAARARCGSEADPIRPPFTGSGVDMEIFLRNVIHPSG